MGVNEAIYARAPHLVRDAMVTIVGLQFARQRYRGEYPSSRSRYDRLQQEDVERQRARQDQLVARLVEHAARHAPFYRELYRGIALPRRASEIARLPVLDKETLRQNLDRLKTRPRDRTLISIHTSGTTGTPMEFFFERADFRERMAILDAWRAWFGVDHGMRRATFSGRVIVPPREGARQFWQTNYALPQRLYSSYHLSQANLARYVANLNEYRPAFIDGYPSAIHVLARYILAEGQPLAFRPKVIFTTAETLTAQCREDVQAAFGCPVRDQYASSEGAPFIVECEADRLHFLTYSGVLEVVDDRGTPARVGRALFTAFHTRYMPLIRYDIGDSVELGGDEHCPCGRSFPQVARILGREEDYLVSSTRGKVGRLDPIFKKIPPSIVRSQIVQRAIDEIDVAYVPDPSRFEVGHLRAVEAELVARLGSNVRIRFKEVTDIPLGARGKLKAVVCQIPGTT